MGNKRKLNCQNITLQEALEKPVLQGESLIHPEDLT